MSGGFQPPTPGPQSQECVFWHDFEELTTGNLWRDKSRNALHATPQAGFAAPNYGLARTARGKGYANFTGAANCYATLPLRYNDVAPTGPATFVGVFSHLTDKNHRVFSSWNEAPGNFRGLHTALAQAGRGSYVYQFQGGAALPVNTTAAAAWALSDLCVVVHSINTVGSCWSTGRPLATSWVGGAFGVGAVDPTIAAAIGRLIVTPDYLVGRCYFLALFRDWIPTDREAKALSSYLRDGGGA